jgi:hypothetical protein
VEHEILQVLLRNSSVGLSCYCAPSSTPPCAPTQWAKSNRTRVGRPSAFNCRLSASRRHVLRRSKAKADLLEINSGSIGNISTECRDSDALESHSAFTALGSIYVHRRFLLHRRTVFRRVVAKSKKLFCITRGAFRRSNWQCCYNLSAVYWVYRRRIRTGHTGAVLLLRARPDQFGTACLRQQMTLYTARESLNASFLLRLVSHRQPQSAQQ